MRIHLNVFLATMLLVLAHSSCEKYPLIPAGENSIWPLTVGNTWTYNDHYQCYKDGQVVIDETEEFSLTVIERSYTFKGDEKVESYLLEFKSNSSRIYQGFRIRFEGKQVLIPDYFVPDTTPGASQTGSKHAECSYASSQVSARPVVVFPIASGTNIEDRRWYWMGCRPGFIRFFEGRSANLSNFPSTRGAVQTQVGPLDTLIQTPAGNFNCMKYGGAYWSEGIGWIKGEYSTQATLTINEIEADSLVRTRELTSYEMK